jgi:uncharacterized protein YceK
MWYTGRMRTLWVLLHALPFTVLVSGCATLITSCKNNKGRSEEQPLHEEY